MRVFWILRSGWLALRQRTRRHLLERADTAIDEFTGAVKRLSPGADQKATIQPRPSRIAAALKTQEIVKPQLQFDHVPQNNETGPFKPLLLSKPHASTPLQEKPTASEHDVQETFAHPYQLEIERYRYPSIVYTQSEPIMYRPLESTAAVFVDTEEALGEMLEELKQATEIAIDLEHHDTRSYIGIVSLMQISTRGKDWIVDTLKPWRRKIQCLNEVFADPRILKVLHGAYMDVMWLQRDLGLYLVGLFDTHHASRALGYPGGSLAYLLKRFVDFDAQKQYQLADWRIRPLPQELLDYARSDTHFLLYIYDNMRNELIQRSDFSKPDHEADKLWEVLQKSSDCALQRYEHPVYDVELGQGSGWYRMLARTPVILSKDQFSVFRAVHKWRDDIAREQDDGLHYVMPNHQIFSVAKAMPLTRHDLLAVVTPATQTIKLRSDELVSIISKSKAAGKDGPDMMEALSKVEPRHHSQQSASAAAQAPSIPPARASVSQSSVTITSKSGSTSVPIRSSESTFWGSAFESSIWNQRRPASTSSIGLSVPLPPLTANTFAEPTETVAWKAESLTPEPIPASRNHEETDDVFVLSGLSRKRKHVESLDGMSANSDNVSFPDERADLTREKAARKAAKKAAAKANGNVSEDGSIRADVPFDYASTPSILNPPREGKESVKDKKKRAKQLNPYAKALDAPNGLPRTQKEKAGKSITYKS